MKIMEYYGWPYTIEIDGEIVWESGADVAQRFVSKDRSFIRARNKFLKRRKRDTTWKHYRFDEMKTTAPDGKLTLFTFPRS